MGEAPRMLAIKHPIMMMPIKISIAVQPSHVSKGPAVGAAQILIWSHSYVFLPPMSTAIRTSAFYALSMMFYIFHRHRDYLVDHVD